MWLAKLQDSRTDENISLKNGIITSQPITWGLWTPSNDNLKNSKISTEYLRIMSDKTYQQVAFMVLRKFDFWVSVEQLESIIKRAYGKQWHHDDITPIKQIGDTNMYSLHLWYGPTFAFKNIALEFLPRLLQAITNNRLANVLWASSWDTVNAAHYGVNGTSIHSIFMLPNTGPSEIQRLQALNGIVDNPNAFTILADVPFDPLQEAVKKINSAEFANFKAEHNITSFNSINIARILAQVVYYFRAYTQLIKMGKVKAGNPVNFSVPSGNFWDALAGLYAREMGLPIAKINVATNENDMLHKFFQTGVYEPPKRDEKDYVQVTNAPSQDIAKSSNFERALFWATNWDYQKVSKWFDQLKTEGKFQVDDATLSKFQEVFTSSTSTDAERLDVIQNVSEKYNHGIDPHTATWVAPIVRGEFGQDLPTIFLETSHVAQFGAELRGKWIIVPWMDEFDKTLEALKGRKPVEWQHFLRSDGSFEDIFAKVNKALEIVNSRTK